MINNKQPLRLKISRNKRKINTKSEEPRDSPPPLNSKPATSAEMPIDTKAPLENTLPKVPLKAQRKSIYLENENKSLKKEVEMLKKQLEEFKKYLSNFVIWC